MFFSVIIPLYNKENYIENTLNHLLNQSFKDFEVIVVDDGSTDSGVQRVKTFNDSRIKLISKVNGGVSNARNYGIKYATARYIAFLDADDWWKEDYLEKMHNMICNNREAGIFCCCNAEVKSKSKIWINPIKKLLKDKVTVLNYQTSYRKILESPIHTSAVIIDRFYLKDNHFDEGVSMGEDILLWLRLTSQTKVLILNEVLSFYNREDKHAATASITAIERTFLPRLVLFLKKPNIYDPILINRLILNMLRPYYLFFKDNMVNRIYSSCDLNLATFSQKVFYRLPIRITRFLYKFYKKIK